MRFNLDARYIPGLIIISFYIKALLLPNSNRVRPFCTHCCRMYKSWISLKLFVTKYFALSFTSHIQNFNYTIFELLLLVNYTHEMKTKPFKFQLMWKVRSLNKSIMSAHQILITLKLILCGYIHETSKDGWIFQRLISIKTKQNFERKCETRCARFWCGINTNLIIMCHKCVCSENCVVGV